MESLRFALTLGMLLWPVHLYAGEQALLIDRSGSVRAHFASGFILDLCHIISDALGHEEGVTIVTFGTSQRKIPNCSQLEPSGEDTELDAAFEYARAAHPHIVWIVTDNIQDAPHSPRVRNTEGFYTMLQRDDVAKVVIFPFLASSPNMQGLIVYAILLSEKDDSFENEILAFLEQAKKKYKTEALRMRPLDRDTINVSEPRIVSNGTRGGHKNEYREGDPIQEVVEIRFHSQFDHLVVKDANISPPHSEWQATHNSPLILTDMQSAITPERIANLTSRGETEGYRVSVQTGPIKLKKDLHSLWTMAFAGSVETVTLDIKFIIQVFPGNFSFKDTFLQSYHAPSETEAKKTGKIYGIATLPEHLATVRTDIPIHIPVKITVDYPWWPALLLIGGLLTALAVAGGLVWVAVTYGSPLLSGGPGWSVKAETSSARSLPCELRRGGEVIVQGNSVGTLRGSTFAVSEGIEGDGGQQQFSLQGETTVKVRKDRTPITLSFTPQTARTRESESTEMPAGRRR